MKRLRRLGKAEWFKLRHTKGLWWTLLGFLLALLWFANSGTLYFMVAGDLLNPQASIGFFKDVQMGAGQDGLQLVRSSQSLTVFSWLIPLNLCVAWFAAEQRARTDTLLVSHGGGLSVLYLAKFCTAGGASLILHLVFYFLCFVVTAAQMRLLPSIKTSCLFVLVSAGNLLVLAAFLALAAALTLLLKSHVAAALLTSLLPLAGILFYQVQYDTFSAQPIWVQLTAKSMPTYYWSRLCALNLTMPFCLELVVWVIAVFGIAWGITRLALRQDRSGLYLRTKRTTGPGVKRGLPSRRPHRASNFAAALYGLCRTRLPWLLGLLAALCAVFALGVQDSQIVDATWSDGKRVGIFPGGSLPLGGGADRALASVLSVGILAWVAVVLVATIAYRQQREARGTRLAVAHGAGRIRVTVGNLAAETVMLQGWYVLLFFLLSTATGAVSQPWRAMAFWWQSALILQATYAMVQFIARLCRSELAGATWCFVVVFAGLIVSVSAPDPAAVSPLSALLFYSTPMPYWLALGGVQPVILPSILYGGGVTAICFAATLALVEYREVR